MPAKKPVRKIVDILMDTYTFHIGAETSAEVVKALAADQPFVVVDCYNSAKGTFMKATIRSAAVVLVGEPYEPLPPAAAGGGGGGLKVGPAGITRAELDAMIGEGVPQ